MISSAPAGCQRCTVTRAWVALATLFTSASAGAAARASLAMADAPSRSAMASRA
jgi:hypothetical protein